MLRKHLPTIPTYLAKRKKVAQNRLPKHLRLPARWPLAIQTFLNSVILITLMTLLLNKDDYLSDAGPAITLIVCLLATIYTIVESFQLVQRYQKINGARWSRLNVGLSLLTFIAWAGTVAIYLP